MGNRVVIRIGGDRIHGLFCLFNMPFCSLRLNSVARLNSNDDFSAQMIYSMATTPLISLFETYYGVVMPPPLKELFNNLNNLIPEKLRLFLNDQQYTISILDEGIAERYDSFFLGEVRSQFASEFQTTDPIIFAEVLPVNGEEQERKFYLSVFPAKARHQGDFARFHDLSIVYPVYLIFGNFPSDQELLEEYAPEDLAQTGWGLQEFVPDLRELTAYLTTVS